MKRFLVLVFLCLYAVPSSAGLWDYAGRLVYGDQQSARDAAKKVGANPDIFGRDPKDFHWVPKTLYKLAQGTAAVTLGVVMTDMANTAFGPVAAAVVAIANIGLLGADILPTTVVSDLANNTLSGKRRLTHLLLMLPPATLSSLAAPAVVSMFSGLKDETCIENALLRGPISNVAVIIFVAVTADHAAKRLMARHETRSVHLHVDDMDRAKSSGLQRSSSSVGDQIWDMSEKAAAAVPLFAAMPLIEYVNRGWGAAHPNRKCIEGDPFGGDPNALTNPLGVEELLTESAPYGVVAGMLLTPALVWASTKCRQTVRQLRRYLRQRDPFLISTFLLSATGMTILGTAYGSEHFIPFVLWAIGPTLPPESASLFIVYSLTAQRVNGTIVGLPLAPYEAALTSAFTMYQATFGTRDVDLKPTTINPQQQAAGQFPIYEADPSQNLQTAVWFAMTPLFVLAGTGILANGWERLIDAFSQPKDLQAAAMAKGEIERVLPLMKLSDVAQFGPKQPTTRARPKPSGVGGGRVMTDNPLSNIAPADIPFQTIMTDLRRAVRGESFNTLKNQLFLLVTKVFSTQGQSPLKGAVGEFAGIVGNSRNPFGDALNSALTEVERLIPTK